MPSKWPLITSHKQYTYKHKQYTYKCLGTCVGEKNRSVPAPIQTLTTVQTGKHTTHTFYKIIRHTLYCGAGWQTLWADTRPLMACWAHPLTKCVCVCVFVVKSTLATVCLSISPVWQRWKELLFRGQPHPTLINNTARASGRDGGGSRGGGRQRRGGTEGAGRAPAQNQQHPTLLSFALTPFPAWLPLYFYLCVILHFHKPTNFLSSLASSRYPPLTLRWRCQHKHTHLHAYSKNTDRHLGSHGTVLSLGTTQHPAPSLLLFILPPSLSSSPASLNSSPPPSLPPLRHLSLCCFLPLSLPCCVVIINTPSSWADIWLESVSSPVAGRSGGNQRGGSEAVGPRWCVLDLILVDRSVLGNFIRAKALHLKYD